MNLLLFLASAIIIFLVAALYSLKRQIKHILLQIKEMNEGESNKYLSISLINKDIIELAAEFNRKIESEEELRRSVIDHETRLKESIANISHDFRTPLTSIIGYIQLIQKSKIDEVQRRNLNIISKKSYELKNLVDDFFELAVLESNETALSFNRINIGNLISDIILENIQMLEEAKLNLEFNIPDNSYFINVDEKMFRRIMQNLISNAVKYSTKDIIISLVKKDRVQIKVKNSIRTTEDINTERIFERFYMEDKSRSKKGTGLGLAIVKLLTEKMNGTIMAESENGYLEIVIEFKAIS